MQTSFMHPPFGFALFYLRSVAARVPYIDKITGKKIQPVTTGQIYWGAVPFVIIQVIMIGLTITFPQMVLRYRDEAVHENTGKIQVPDLGNFGFNPFQPPAGFGGKDTTAPAAPPALDLGQP
jgi:hypothetical protein